MQNCICYLVQRSSTAGSNLSIIFSQGQHWGWKRSHCDTRFKQDMYKLCETKIGRRKRWGISWVTQMLWNKVKRCRQLDADWYYNAVFVAGGWYWEKVSPSWCKASCAKSLGDPSTPLING